MGKRRKRNAGGRKPGESGIPSPCLSDSRERLADWLELCALKDSDRNASFSDLVRDLDVSGSFDASPSLEDTLEDEDVAGAEIAIEEPVQHENKNKCEAAAEGAFLEVSERFVACGDNGAYPFEVGDNYLEVRDETAQSVYVFLLLLSTFGHDAGPARGDGAKLFEEVSAQAAETYLGGNRLACSKVFGFPRRLQPKDFGPALDDLCRAMGEGVGHRERPTSKDQKDAKLDVVAWRGFPDGRRGKLIAFGQCATGANWPDKLTELQPQDWCRFWMQETPATLPIRLFFVPHRIEEQTWFHTCVHGGVLFERCRIAHLAQSSPADLVTRLTAWSRFVLDRALRVQAQLADLQ
jgi:hypothetical protein